MASVKKKIILKSRSVGATTTFAALALFFAKSNSNIRDDIDDSMALSLDKVNPKFRNLTDLLFFTDRMDLDLSEFKPLLRENYDVHQSYLWDRFIKGVAIYWNNGSEFWSNRLEFLISLNDKILSNKIENVLEKRMFEVVRTKHELDIQYNIEYLQFLELCKIKASRNESLASAKVYFTEVTSNISSTKLVSLVRSFIPTVFSSMEEYITILTKNIVSSARNFELLQALEQQGILFNKAPVVQLALSIVNERIHNEKNRRAFFTIISDSTIRNMLKSCYKPDYKEKILHLITACDYQMIEEHHLRNIKSIIDLDESLADDLAVIYADKLYQRSTGHKKANADRLIRLINQCPQISSKKILAYLSSNNKMNDIKYILNSFPNLKKLAAFM